MTWKFVTMCPALSSTKPEPSDFDVCGADGKKRLGCDCVTLVAVIWTTPGPSCR